MSDDDYNKRMSEKWQQQYEEMQKSKERWQSLFGWTAFVGVFAFVIMSIVASVGGGVEVVQTGYTPEQVTDLSIRIYKQLCNSTTEKLMWQGDVNYYNIGNETLTQLIEIEKLKEAAK